MSVLGVVCGIAFLSGSNPPPPPPPRIPLGDSGCFTIYQLQHEVGSENYTSSLVAGGHELVTRWAFRYLGTDVRLEETLKTSPRGSPLRLQSHGQTSTLTDVDQQSPAPASGHRLL